MTSLEIWDLNVSQDALAALPNIAPLLNNLTLNELSTPAKSLLLDAGLCSRLRELHLIGLSWLDDECLGALTQHAGELGTLCISHCKKGAISSRVLRLLVQRLGERLLSLQLNSCSGVDDLLGMAISEHCVNLEHLSLYDGNVTDKSICPLVSKLGALRHLRLALTGVSCDTLRALSRAACGEQLLSLDISELYNVTKDGVEDFLGIASALQKLNLSGNDEVDDETIMLLCNSCHTLSHLDVSGCEEITDTGLSQLISECDALAVINVTNCKGISVKLKLYLEEKLNPSKTKIIF